MNDPILKGTPKSVLQLTSRDFLETFKYVYQTLSLAMRFMYAFVFLIACVCSIGSLLLYIFDPGSMSYTDMMMICASSISLLLFPFSLRLFLLLTAERKSQSSTVESQIE